MRTLHYIRKEKGKKRGKNQFWEKISLWQFSFWVQLKLGSTWNEECFRLILLEIQRKDLLFGFLPFCIEFHVFHASLTHKKCTDLQNSTLYSSLFCLFSLLSVKKRDVISDNVRYVNIFRAIYQLPWNNMRFWDKISYSCLFGETFGTIGRE